MGIIRLLAHEVGQMQKEVSYQCNVVGESRQAVNVYRPSSPAGAGGKEKIDP